MLKIIKEKEKLKRFVEKLKINEKCKIPQVGKLQNLYEKSKKDKINYIYFCII